MTELVASVRLKADGSGLVGQANAASAAVKGVGAAAAGATSDAKGFAAATAGAETAARGLAGGADAADRAVGQLGAVARDMAAGQRQASAAIGEAGKQIDRHSRQLREAANDNARHAFGMRNLGQQFGDLSVMIQGGIDPIRAFSTQAGQMGYALSEMGGRAGKVGAFLTGPWGIALTIATTTLAPFVQQLFAGSEAADEAAKSAEGLTKRVGDFSTFFDTVTGKVKETNRALIEFAALTRQQEARALRGVQRDAQAAGNAALADSQRLRMEGGGLYVPGGASTSSFVRPNGDLAAIIRSGRNIDAQLRDLASSGSSNAARAAEILRQRATFQQAAKDIEKSDAEVRSLLSGVLDPSLKDGKKTRTPRPKSTAARDEFGRDTADRLAGLAERFDDTPSALRDTNKELRQLDDLIDDLGRKRPPGFKELIADAEAAKVAIRIGIVDGLTDAFEKPRTLADQAKAAFVQLDAIAADLEKRQPPGYAKVIAEVERARGVIIEALVRPFDDFVQAQLQSFQIGQLTAQGRVVEAETLRTIVQLEKTRGPLSDQQKAAVLASNQALAAQERQIERLHRRQQTYLDALGDVQSIVRQTIYEGPSGLKELPTQLGEAFKRFTAERLTESLFGDSFDKLRDQITGTRTVEDASEKMAAAVEVVTTRTDAASTALDGFTGRLNRAAQAVGSAAPAGAAGGLPGAADPARAALPPLNLSGQIAEALGDIVVTGRRDPFASSIGEIAKVLGKQIGIDDAKAERLGGVIGGTVSKGLRGAVEGQAAASVAGILGIRTSGTGSSIGGAIGSSLPIPGGSILGGLTGGLIGGLFAPRERPGGATVSAIDGQAAVSGTVGRDRDGIKVGSGLAGQVAGGLNEIVTQLGGTLGAFDVAIGTYKDDLRVNVGGRALGGVKGSGASSFGDDQAAAVSYAISLAVSQGAVQGLSKAVAAALQSSPDIDKAMREALKVQQLETLLGGVGGQLTAVFKQFDAEAAERVRLARRYSLDLLQVEKINAEQRADLFTSTMKARVAPLQDLVASMNSGELFEGDAGQRRDAIRKELDGAKVAADRGEDGALDRYADLLGRLVVTSREGFGTAGGEYGADRAFAAAEAARLIKVEEDRVRSAAGLQAATTKAVEDVGRLTNEGNDMLAEIDRGIRQLVDLAQQGRNLSIRPDLAPGAY